MTAERLFMICEAAVLRRWIATGGVKGVDKSRGLC